jgi:hypothetical protein
MGRHGGLSALIVASVLGIATAAVAGESLALLTELRLGQGRVEVKMAATGQWQPAAPLLSLAHGDAVRATGNASAVLVFSDGRGSVRVTTANSPLILEAKAGGESKLQKTLVLLQESLGFLKAVKKPETTLIRLGTRAAPDSLLLVSPRETAVLPGSLIFEWRGAALSGYTVRVLSPSGVIFERPNLPRPLFRYPADASRLSPGVRYTWQVRAGSEMQEAWFLVVDEPEARRVQEALGELQTAVEPDARITVAALKGALLRRRGLNHDARRLLLEAIQQDPEEPALHLLLGDLYARAGLSSLASDAYGESERLLR